MLSTSLVHLAGLWSTLVLSVGTHGEKGALSSFLFFEGVGGKESLLTSYSFKL